MIEIQSYPVAVLMCVLAMTFWGSWQNTQVLAGKKWRFELFYWDYAMGILLMSLIAAFTIGSMGSQGRTFLADLKQADLKYLGLAFLGGCVWNLGTLCLVAAISLAGMAVAFTYGGGLAWVLGIWVQYVDKPEGDITLLALGSLTIVIAVLLSMMAYKRISQQQKKGVKVGTILSLMVGVMIAFYYLFVQRSIDTQFTAETAGKITNYTAVVCFSVGVFVSTFVYNSYFMRKPVEGPPLTAKDYFAGTSKEHFWSVVGGMIWCFGNIFSFMAVKAAGPAISYGLSLAAPLVAAIWGVFVWKEFRGAPKGTNTLLAAMFVFYILSLVLITAAKI